MHNWLDKLADLSQQGIPCVMVTVASTLGSTPREVGSKMIVTRKELFGTIGGGNLEFKACSIARDQIENAESKQVKRFPLGAALGQCCGGLVNLLFEPISGSCDWIREAIDYQSLDREWVREVPMHVRDSQIIIRPCFDDDKTGLSDQRFIEVNPVHGIELTLFGAGHVGRSVVYALRDLPVRIRWVDSRDEAFPQQIPPNVEAICTDTPETEIDAAGEGAYFLVMTHEHGLDQLLCEQILKRDDFAYFGLIGSAAKRRMFETRLQRRGIDRGKFHRMTCPVGIDGITGKQPAMIAISVAAQIMQVYDSAEKSTQIKPQKEMPASSSMGEFNYVG